MSKELSTVDREILVEIVKLVQKRGLKGAKGEWKEFLTCYDRKFGASLSDPAKRSTDILMAFLETFSRQEDLEFFSKVMRRHENLKAMKRLVRDFPDCESPQQKLIRLTVGHPQYVQHYTFPSHNEDWKVIPLGKVSELANANSMISVDCEMVLCEDGTEAVVKVCAVDHNLESVLGTEVRKDGDPHNCLADAEAAMKLVLAKIEHGFDDPIIIESKKVAEADLAKLLLHRIPVDVPSQDLLKLFPDYSNINIQPELRISGQTYSTYVVFKDCKEAFEAFEEIEGQEEKDSSGRPQKLVSLSLNKSKTIGFYVRKMVPDAPPGDSVTLKRNANAGANGEELKRQRTVLHECNHVKEIERLKQELHQRDEEIFNLQKALSDFMERSQN